MSMTLKDELGPRYKGKKGKKGSKPRGYGHCGFGDLDCQDFFLSCSSTEPPRGLPGSHIATPMQSPKIWIPLQTLDLGFSMSARNLMARCLSRLRRPARALNGHWKEGSI